eukprot:gb/GFBE01003568.1/.p1 GENE.gb/GFBE01003568.1/~~gb/GFBE01003568.1/.p1  ORF type:complete len:403 (+),score=94.27 gb/GFBE01003568.1/:1-1209(+)
MLRTAGSRVRQACLTRLAQRLPAAPSQQRAFADGEGPLVQLSHGAGAVSKLTLCRPKKLNSLSLPMIVDLKQKYQELQPAGARCLILDGEGRALCAGGDVAEVRQGVLDGSSYPADFFFEEYQLDYAIATLYERTSILQVSLWDGIVMGGGVGLSIHSPIRIATEKTLFAMPETGIGLFPDVGATWALSRLKSGAHVGMLLGLTGQRLGAADCLFAGVATHYCPSERLPDLEDKLRGLKDQASDLNVVSDVIAEVAGGSQPDTEKAVLEANADAIQRCFGDCSTSAEDIVTRLEKEGSDFASKTLKTLLQKSPLSVKVSLEALKRHQSVTLKDAIIAEYRLSQWFMRPQPQSDFCEGIRSVLIDKDNQPQWQPASLKDVSQDKVDEFFAPLPASHARGELQL